MGQSAIDFDTLAVLDELFGNNLYLSELFPPYRDQVEAAKKSLALAINDHDGKSVIFHAHGLKSSSAQLGALRVSSVCQQLESLGHSLNWVEIGVAFAQLQSETTDALNELSILELDRRTKAA